MKAFDTDVLTLIKNAPQFIIPIYQRTYQWSEDECQQLWTDIRRVGQNPTGWKHFCGSIVYIADDVSTLTQQAPVLVIDGQQRLTSVILLLAAICREVGEDEPVEGFSALALRDRYLIDPHAKGNKKFKLQLTKTDRETLNAIVQGMDAPDNHSIPIKRNFELFRSFLKKDKTALIDTCIGLSRLAVVDVALERSKDNPQLVFESMNSTGKKLAQADLIRNYVLMGLDPDLQTQLYTLYWEQMETGFGQTAYAAQFDSFMRHYLTAVTGSIPRIDEVYDAYKIYAQDAASKGRSIEDLVREMWEHSKSYIAMALGQEKYAKLAAAFQDLRELRVDVAYPFLFDVYGEYAADRITAEEVLEIVRMIEAYVFRRAVCTVPTNSMNKTFATFAKSIKRDRYVESVKAAFLTMKSYRRFPSDEEFVARIQDRDLYNFRSKMYWLRKFENYDRKERVEVDEYSVEHIMPQNENMPKAWRDALGPDWAAIRDRWLHTLGNLTLTGYNSEYSDKSFSEKRDMKGGFKESPLQVNQGLGQIEVWDEAAIKARAERMAKKAAKVWTAPSLAAGILAAYQSAPTDVSDYTIDDHQNLASEKVRNIFEAFRREVLALDPSVTEQFLKLYVAYKAETNFADVVPQAKALLIFLNIDLHELHDPRKIAIDVSTVGHWGNGNTEVRLSELDDIAYVVGLVRQALDKQIGLDISA